jgi:hypothetical protein
MKVKTFVILEMAIEEGVRRGYRRAFKHNESPSEDSICEEIENGVMSAINDYFTFDEKEYL